MRPDAASEVFSRRPDADLSCVRSPLDSVRQNRRLMAHSAAAIYGGGAFVGLVEALVPGGPGVSIGAGLVALVLGALLLVARSRLSRRAMALLGPIGVALIAYTLATAHGEGDGAVLYMWPALWTAFFFGRRGAVLIVACIGIAHGIVVVSLPAASSYPDRWIDVMVSVSVVAGVMQALARRNDELLARREQAVRERTTELEESRLEMLRRLALAAEYRDDITFQHTERVGQTAFLLAEILGLPEDQASLIRLAGPLHDIGKLGVSDRILLKPGKLTAAEFERVKEHTTNGAHILADSSSDVLQLAEQIARSHHEWWNGRGYPDGLKGDQIPLAARIVGLADVFDALTHDRPYKDAWSVEAATAHIQALCGSQFDPAIVHAFNQLDLYQLVDRAEPGATKPQIHTAVRLAA